MINKYAVTFEVNMNASHEETVIVKANTERKARIKATQEIAKSFWHARLIKIELVNTIIGV